MNWKRVMRNLKLKAQLSAALLVAAAYSISHLSSSWGRILAALRIWIDFARDPHRTPRWIYYSRVRTCYQCPFFYRPLRTCGSPLSKELRDMGCHCNVIYAASVLEKTCWYRDQTNDDTDFGWDASLTRLSGFHPRAKTGCGGCGSATAKTVQSQ